MHFVYILHSPKYDKYYIGQTPDLETRLLFHNKLSKTSFTSKYRPWILVASLKVPSRGMAMKIEKYLKKKSRTFVKRLINEEELKNWIIEKFSTA